GSAGQAKETAERLCADQTIEAPEELLHASPKRSSLLGKLEAFETHNAMDHRAIISFPVELFGDSCPQLLHTLFGTASLRAGIQVTGLRLPKTIPRGWPGPRYGQTGLRVLADVHHRPLVCAVLKPLGFSPAQLADLASQFALGGVDLIKDDQGLADHHFCRFEERVRRCVDAVQEASRQTQRPCLYFPHITGTTEEIAHRLRFAHTAGADGALLCPGLIGYGAVHEIARDPGIALPVISHPAFLGTYMIERRSGLAPHVLYGQLPRLIGADISIFPIYGLDFPISRDECRQIADACSIDWGNLAPIFPTAAGRMGEDRIAEMHETFGQNCLFVLGSQIRQDASGIAGACKKFMVTLEQAAR
ncbi:MAG TPA: RuBisCO large subunit C-terminal-like domain-containing protein, partial [Nitrospiraceae bacterium]|nr:RuBisCO large subunit C-terminal-like domain-containing protein [Nitrospiraceae bacterium]